MPSCQMHHNHQAYRSRTAGAHIEEGAELQQDRYAALLGSSQALSHAAPVRARNRWQMWSHMPQILYLVVQARACNHLLASAMCRVL